MKQASHEIQERKLLGYDHVMRRDETKRVMDLVVNGTRNRGRPRRKWIFSVRERENKCNGIKWKTLARNISSDDKEEDAWI